MATATLKGRTDGRVDAIIEGAPEFARPILGHVRALVHDRCPDVEETIKWSRPTFVYRGKILCVMAVFKAHCSLGFWQSDVAAQIARDGHGRAGDSAGQFGRITSLADLPADTVLGGYIAEAARLLSGGEAGTPRPAPPRPRRAEIPVPETFAALLKAHPEAAATFEKFSPSHRREYLEWIVGAKREETRLRRMTTAIGWLGEGKTKEWRYQ